MKPKPASYVIKKLFIDEFNKSRITKVELAKRMKESDPRNITRMFDLKRSTRLDKIERGLLALGFRLSISIVRDNTAKQQLDLF